MYNYILFSHSFYKFVFMHHAYDLKLLETMFPQSHHPVLNTNIFF